MATIVLLSQLKKLHIYYESDKNSSDMATIVLLSQLKKASKMAISVSIFIDLHKL